ncbi:MAG: holin-like protein [Fusobacteria bacterium]|nr:MAG: holin-like protein [Fusobacteriota bacterium]KAF0229841.1 MAG: holin-like [Fusobacteriota bacterium]
MKLIKKILNNFIIPLAILLMFQLIGNLINSYILKFIPGPIIGMLLLLLAMTINIIPYELMKNFSAFLVKHISFFLIPTSVSLIVIIPRIDDYVVRIILLLILSLIIVLIVSGSFASWYSRKTIKGDTDE